MSAPVKVSTMIRRLASRAIIEVGVVALVVTLTLAAVHHGLRAR